jgi:pyridinium-3,5-biscarboxylic acid mononucleotide sulfurtransferase
VSLGVARAVPSGPGPSPGAQPVASTPLDEQQLAGREAQLRSIVASCASMIVAYSGGVDSAYLAWLATNVLGRAALCVTADSPSYPERHRQLALQTALAFGLNHEIIRTGEFERPEYRANPINRCYYCKHELYDALTRIARARGIAVLADGSNADDRGDYRPGRQAAREFGVRSPLDEAGLTKREIRELARRAGLPVWDEPASACLSSRIPYGSEVTPGKLQMIEAAEQVLRELGFRVYRVRHHDTLARLEIGAGELSRACSPEVRDRLVTRLREIGYTHVTLDLQGYRMGSLNEGLPLRPV